jgi:competence ComEA-like helix-hairpin-helix protein
MNRYFNFSPLQIKLLIFLVGLLLVGSVLEFVRSYATVEKNEFKFSVKLGDGDQTYSPVFKVDLNISPADSLELIPGIGPVLAMRIVAYRDSVGRYEKPEDILEVLGIGYKKFEKIKPYIEVRAW